MKVNLLFLLCFALYLRAIFQVQAPERLIFGRAIQQRVFHVTPLGGLYLNGTFTWKGLFLEFYGTSF